MTLQELGVYLSEVRQEKSLNISEVADFLKLSPRIVRAMEEANLDDLPHVTYVRAFYRTYASMLAIDPNLVKTVLEEISLETSEETTSLRLPVKTSKHRLGTLLFLFIIIMALFAGFYAIMSSSMLSDISSLFNKPTVQRSENIFSGNISTAKPQEEPQQRVDTGSSDIFALPVTEKELAKNALSPEPMPEISPKEQIQAVIPTNSQRNMQIPETPTPPVTTTPQLDPPTEPAQVPQNLEAPETPSRMQMNAGTRHTLLLTGVDSCWLKVTTDGAVRQFLMEKGQTLTIRFNNRAVLRLGNAGGVRAELDGKNLPPFGSAGEVRTVTIPLP